jgi:hypothetical protein
MATPTVRTAGPSDEERVLAVVTLAFSTDPPSRWMYRDAREYVTHFPSFIRAFGGTGLPSSTLSRWEIPRLSFQCCVNRRPHLGDETKPVSAARRR